MNLLLLYPPAVAGALWGKMSASSGHSVPMGLACLAASAVEAGHSVTVLDCLAENLSMPGLRAWLAGRTFEAVGISVLTPLAGGAFEAAEQARRALPGAVIILGGPHVTAFPEQTLAECPASDVIVCGEGERTLVELLAALSAGKEPGGVAGLVYRSESGLVKTESRLHIDDLDSLPLPAYDLLPMTSYRPPATKYRRLPAHTVVATRGCPFSCTFCCNVVHGRKVRYRGVGNILEEVRLLHEVHGARSIIFQDSSLTQSRPWLAGLCEALHRSGLGIEWSCLARVDQVDAGLLKIMKRAGCWQISYGLESGNQKSLDFLKKRFTLEQSRQAVRLTHRAGIQVRATYMLAIPGEDYADALETIRFARELSAMYATFMVTVPFPGTTLYQEVRSLPGAFDAQANWSAYSLFNKEAPVFIPPGLSQQDLDRLVRHAYRSYYTTPGVLWRHLRNLRSPHDLAKYFHGIRSLVASVFS